VGLVLAAAISLDAVAQTEPGEQLSPEEAAAQARYEAAFETMMRDLGNPELSFEFAEAAVEVGDVRGAIAALERILLINPNLPNIALELGVLYYTVGNNALAAQYLNQVLTAPQVPAPMRQRAEATLVAAEAAVTRHQFHGQLFAGLRIETNANAAPDAVRLTGQPDLEPDEPEKEDLSGLASAFLEYDYLLGTQAGDAIETNTQLFGQWYGREQELNSELINFDIGPRLDLGSVEAPLVSIRPFFQGLYLRLDDQFFLSQLGGGLELTKTLTPRLYADASVTVVDQNFDNTPDNPTASDRSGIQALVTTGLAFLMRPTTTLSGRFTYTRRASDEDFEAFNRFALGLAATQRYAGPFQIVEDEPWSATLALDLEYTDYDQPDPQVDPDDSRNEFRIDVVLINSIPMAASFYFVTTGRYTNVESNQPNNEFDNWQLTAGVSYRF
jgi:tetratricopeptide (TPR) repeat protein